MMVSGGRPVCCVCVCLFFLFVLVGAPAELVVWRLAPDFDADKVLVHFLQAIQDLKGRIQKGEEANAELRTQLDAANAHAAHARKAARKAAAVAATSASAATASPHQAAATQSGGDGKRETRVSKPGDSATVTQDEGGAGASADENKSSTSQAPPERDSKLTLRPASASTRRQALNCDCWSSFLSCVLRFLPCLVVQLLRPPCKQQKRSSAPP